MASKHLRCLGQEVSFPNVKYVFLVVDEWK